jgi:hypothetical protein
MVQLYENRYLALFTITPLASIFPMSVKCEVAIYSDFDVPEFASLTLVVRQEDFYRRYKDYSELSIAHA